MELSLSLATQIGAMFLMVIVGFILVRQNILSSRDTNILSLIVLYVAAPCAIINSFQIELTAENMKGFALSFAAAVIMNFVFLAFTYGLSGLFHFSDVETCSLIYPNCGNLVIPLVTLVLGEDMVFYCSGCMMVQTVFLWTHCKAVMSKDARFDWKKILLNINIIAIAIGFLMFVLNLKMPAMPDSAITSMGNTMAPLSMFVVGMLLSNIELKKVFTNKRAWLICAIRLVVMPLLLMMIFVLTGMTRVLPNAQMILMVTMLGASGPAASTVTQFAALYDNQPYESSLINAMSVILCIVTMPLMNLVYTLVTGL